MKKENTKSPISPEVRAILNENKKEMKQYVDTLMKASSKETKRYVETLMKASSKETKRYVETLMKASSKETKRYVDTLMKASSEDFRRYTGALSEDFQSKVSILAEQVIGTNDKVSQQGEKLDEVIRIQNTHTEMIGAIMEDVSEIKEELKNKASKTEVARLERRVALLE